MATLSSFSRVAAAAALTLPLVFAAANANAGGLIPGQCYEKNVAKAVLQQEGQDIIIGGSRLTTGKERPPNAFYLNKQGYGYNVEINKDGQFCPASAYKNARLNNPNNPNIPEWALSIKTTGNGIDVRKAHHDHGARLVFIAQSYTTKADGTEILGKYVSAIVGAGYTNGSVWSIDSQGRPDTLFDMEKVGITQYMANLINDSPMAAVSVPPRLAMK